MFTKNAMGNMINRYNAVLSKCRLLNVFGTLALAGTLTLGSVGAGDACAYAIPNPQKDAYSVFEKDENTNYYTTFTVDGKSYGIKLNKSIVNSGLNGNVALTRTADYGAIAELVGTYSREGYTIVVDDDKTGSTFDLSFNGVSYYFNVFTSNVLRSVQAQNGYTYIYLGNNIDTDPLTIDSENTLTSIESSDFIGNESSTGGAINNAGTDITISNTNFIGNTSTKEGGAIYNSGSNTSITGNFIGNLSTLQAGAIYNRGSITSITADFIGNKADSGAGGAIYNSGTIGTITGDFIENKAGVPGGAIDNTNGKITSITGNFINNATTSANADGGGAICNLATGTATSTIGSITGDFINNSTAKKGGAICNLATDTATSTIGDISGDFIGNKTTGNYGYGGAIYNSGVITTVSGNFIENKASGNYGGAIYNAGTITAISGDFVGNSAGAYGGAIYAEGNLNFLAAGKGYSFTNNVVGSEKSADYNALYFYTRDTAVTFNLGDASNAKGSFTMNDGISGKRYTVAITGEGSSEGIGDRTFNLNDEIDANGSVIVAGATLTLGTFAHTGATDASGNALRDTTTVGSVLGSLVIGASGGTAGASGKTSKLLVNITDAEQTALIKDLTVNTGSTAVIEAGTLKLTGASKLYGTMTAGAGTTVILDGKLTIGSTSPSGSGVAPTVTLAGLNVSKTSIFDIDNGKVVLTGDSVFEGCLYMGQGTGIVAKGAHVTVHQRPSNPDAYLFAKGSKSTITVDDLGDGGIANFSVYADEGGKLILGALPTGGESKVQYDYIASQMGGAFDSKDMLYIGLGKTLTMASGARLVVDGAPVNNSNPMPSATANPTANPTTTSAGAIFGANSLLIANVAGLGADTAVINGGGNALTVDANSALGLVNASEGEYTILDNFGTVTNAPWNKESVTIGNCLLVVDSVTGSGTDADPYKVTVRQDVNKDEDYTSDGGGALEDVMNSGEYRPDTTNPLAQYLYQAGEKGDEALNKAKSNTASAGANAGVGSTGMAATRAAAATTSMRNTVAHVGPANKLQAAGGTLLIKDAHGNVKAEYDNVIQVADNGSLSDAPAALGGAGSGLDTGLGAGLGNSIALWAMPFYGHESISGVHVGAHSNDRRTDMYGMTMGIDKTFTPSGIDVCRFGLAFNVGTGETEGSGYTGSSQNDFDFFGLTAYGSMRKGAAMLSASASYTNAHDEFSSEGIQGKADTNVWYGVLHGEYAFTLGALESSVFFSNFNIVPYVGMGFMTSKVADYTTSLGSSIETDRQNVFTFPVGLKFNKEFVLDSGWILMPEMTAGVIFAEGDLSQRTVTGNSLGSNLDTITSQVVDSTTMALGLSFDMRKDNVGVFFDYSLEKSLMRTAHGVAAKVEYRF